MSYEGLIPKNTVTTERSNDTTTASDLIHSECLELLQVRNHEEEKSARLYEDMYMFLNNSGYTGAAKLWHKYAHEEATHADWAREYMMSLGIQPELRALPLLSNKYKDLAGVIKESYKHEIEITKQCKALAASAMKHGDFMLYELAGKYLKEQIEELDKVQTWMDKLEIFGTDATALRLLDNEMGQLG